jgi:dolichyl-phosphate-mannose-protein mannosyltransferase
MAKEYNEFSKVALIAKEQERDIRYIRVGDIVRLKHVATDSYLKTHDVASPLTQTNMEVTTITEENLNDPEGTFGSYEDNLWRVVIPDKPAGSLFTSKKDAFKLLSVTYPVALFSTKKGMLPDWGFKMQEVNGNKDTDARTGNMWTVSEIKHPRFVDGSCS